MKEIKHKDIKLIVLAIIGFVVIFFAYKLIYPGFNQHNDKMCLAMLKSAVTINVVDEKNNPLSNVNISYSERAINLQESPTGSYSGLYGLTGQYTFVIKKSGYITQTKAVKIKSDKECHQPISQKINIVLKQQ